MTSDNDVRRDLIREHGRCVCPSDFCLDDPLDDDHCPPCAHLDPERSCFHDPEDPWPAADQVVAGEQRGSS